MPEIEDDRTGEYIWYSDFKSHAVAAVIRSMPFEDDRPVRTYGELALLSEEALLAAGIGQGELSVVKGLLAVRKLSFVELPQE